MKYSLTLVLALLSTSALALDFTRPITGIDGNPLKDCPTDKPNCDMILTLSSAVTLALTLQPNVPPTEKFKRGELALRVYNAKDINLKVEEIAAIKEAVAAVMTPVVVLRVYEALDPQEKSK